MSDPWLDVLAEKISERELIASWASVVGYGEVRDHIRKATHELILVRDRRKAMVCDLPDQAQNTKEE